MTAPRDTLLTLAKLVGAGLKARGWMLATAESCTGGWAAEAVTAIPGSSAWFERGFVTYSNDAKRDMLGVRAETLAQHGAVSEETAREMAGGALLHSRASIALAVTGIAGQGDAPVAAASVFAGGDDYELAFTAPPDQRDAVRRAAEAAGVAVTCIGGMRAGEGVAVRGADGAPMRFAAPGYDHFR
jgi:PncC family amidohydrolase